MHADVLSSSAIKRRGWLLLGDSFLRLGGKDTTHVSTLVFNWGQNTKGALRNPGNIRTQTLHQTRFHSASWLVGSWNARLKIIAFFWCFLWLWEAKCSTPQIFNSRSRGWGLYPMVSTCLLDLQSVVGKVCSDVLGDKEKSSWVYRNVNQ